MYKNRAPDGRNNICGLQIKRLRQAMPDKPSQRELAGMLQLAGLDVEKNAVQAIESGKRFVTDVELKVIARVLNVRYEELLGE